MRLRRATRRLLLAIAAWQVCCRVLAASTQPVTLIYNAPTDCPDQHAVLERISVLVRRQPATPVSAQATITRHLDGYRLELRIGEGRQHISANSCESLVQSLSVILALAIDPQAGNATQLQSEQRDSNRKQVTESPARAAVEVKLGPSFTGPPPTAPTAVPPVFVPPPRNPVPPPPSLVTRSAVIRVTGSVTPVTRIGAVAPQPIGVNQPPPKLELHPTLLLLTEYGMLPRLAHGISLGSWLDRGKMSLALTSEWLVPMWEQMSGLNPQRGGHISFLGASVELCTALTRSVPIRTCAGVELGDMMGKGSGVSNPRLGHSIWLAGVADIVVRPKIWSQMGADLRFGIAIPVKRAQFVFDQIDWHYAPNPWSLRLQSGFSFF